MIIFTIYVFFVMLLLYVDCGLRCKDYGQFINIGLVNWYNSNETDVLLPCRNMMLVICLFDLACDTLT